jgi:hypothetical protein
MANPRPIWANSQFRTKQFQDWVKAKYPGTIKGKGGVGMFGPQTTGAWSKYGDEYAKTVGFVPETGSKGSIPDVLGGTSPASAITPVAPSFSRAQAPDQGVTGETAGIGSKIGAIAPFISNITNLLRKPPAAPRPNLSPLVTARKPKLVSQREDIDRQIKGVNNTADLALDSNTAAAVKAANLVGGLRAKGQSYESEANLGIQVDNETNKLNAGITASNLQKIDQYQQNQVEGQIARQREGSENIANAADKYIQIQAAKDAKDLDRQKFDILSKVYSQSGVTDRLVKQILGKKPGEEVTDEEYKSVLNRSAGSFKMGGSLKKMFANGGSLIEDPKPNPKFTSMAEITATNSFFRKMAKERHLVSGDDTYVAKKVGDPKPFIKYIDENGKTSPKPFKDIQKPLATTVPSGITIDDIKSSGNLYWYEDPHTGDVVDIDPHRVFPNLRPPVQKLNGGKINGRIGSMPHMKGRIKKLY